MNTAAIPVILVHNARDNRYEAHSIGEAVHMGIYDNTPNAVTILTSLIAEQFEAEVVPINGRQGQAILAALVLTLPHLRPSHDAVAGEAE